LCRRCQYQFTRRDDHETPEEVKQAAVTLYGYGLSLNAVGHLLNRIKFRQLTQLGATATAAHE